MKVNNLIVILLILFSCVNKKNITKESAAVTDKKTLPSKDSLLYERSNLYEVYQDSKKGTYYILDAQNNKRYNNLVFIKQLFGTHFQAIDANYNIIYITDSLQKVSQLPEHSFRVCGTVPHYTLKVEKTDAGFIATSHQTFQGYGNQTDGVFAQIPTNQADQVWFQNLKSNYSYNGNSGVGSLRGCAYKTLIIKKNQGYKIYDQKILPFLYDEIQPIDNYLKIKKGDLYTFYPMQTVPEFILIKPFKNYLAKGILKDKTPAFLTRDGLIIRVIKE